MATLSTKTRLEVLEQEILQAEYEAFFYIGQRLLEIRSKRLYEQKDYKSWEAYCASGRLDVRRSQANEYIRASEVRPSLPELPKTAAGMPAEWTVRQVIELAKCKTTKDVTRVAKGAISLAKKLKVAVTAKLIAEVRDAETTKADDELDAASLDKHLQKLAKLLSKWRTSLEQIDPSQWDSVERSTLICVKSEAGALLKFLRS